MRKFTEILEEMLQLDEISGKKLGSYIQKAHKSKDELTKKTQDIFNDPKNRELYDKANSDRRGIRKDKHGFPYKTDSERSIRSFARHQKALKKDGYFDTSRKSANRARGIESAIKKLRDNKLTD